MNILTQFLKGLGVAILGLITSGLFYLFAIWTH